METTSWQRAAPRLGHWLMAGAIGGVAMGAGLRFAMRMAAVTEGQPTVFTPAGTFFILFASVTLGLVLGLLYGVIPRRVPGRGLGRGLVAGSALAVVLGSLLFGSPDSEARVIGSLWMNLLTFGASFVLWGVVAEWTLRWLEGRRRLEVVAAGWISGVGAGAATAFILAGAGVFRWTSSGPRGLGSLAGALAGFTLLGALMGGALGIVQGWVDGQRFGSWIYAGALVGLWLLIALQPGEEGLSGSPRAPEIIVVVSAALLGFAVLSRRLVGVMLDRLRTAASSPPVLVTAEDRMGR